MLLRRPLLPAFLVTTVLVLAGLVVAVPRAQASSTVLCTGFKACKQLGMGHAGYKKQMGTMWWRMYSGHNCTNYAAYRMVRAGMSTERPWSGSGMAGNWGTANKSITDKVPAVGAIAWWKSGHVAYVEQVSSSEEIVVSEDSWSGKNFDWRRVRAGSSWPTGFIHFPVSATPGTPPVTPPGPTPSPEPLAQPVRPDLRVVTVPKSKRRVRVKVKVLVPAATRARRAALLADGTVRIRVAQRARTVRLVNGKAKVSFRKLRRGNRVYAVKYPGSDQLLAAKEKGRIWVRR